MVDHVGGWLKGVPLFVAKNVENHSSKHNNYNLLSTGYSDCEILNIYEHDAITFMQ